MKKIAVLILFFLLITYSANAKIIKFVQVADAQFQKNNVNQINKFANEINKNYNNLDFIVFTGDNINNPEAGNLYAFLKAIKKINTKKYVILGDRDLAQSKDVTSKNYMYLTKKILGRYHSSTPNYIFQKGDIVFVAMNGVKEYFPGYNGYYKDEELIWLDETLTKYSNKKVVLLAHFPIIDTKTEMSNLWQKPNYIEILNKHKNIIAIISGHYRTNLEVKYNDIYNIITTDFKTNGAYKIIEIDDKTGFITTSLVE